LKSKTEELAVLSDTINENMKNIANAMKSTMVKSTELSVSSQQLRQMASEMKKSLSGFKL
jgi:methyl-accepting chemotaxis protein